MISTRRRSGFSLIEMVVVLALLGIFALAVSPSIMNVLRNRTLEGTAKGIQMEINRAKNLAIKNKVNVRVRFVQPSGQPWKYGLQREMDDGTWEAWPGSQDKLIPTQLGVTINLPTPDLEVEFSPLGMVEGYSATNNSITLSSAALKVLNQPDVRRLLIFAGGSVRYFKESS